MVKMDAWYREGGVFLVGSVDTLHTRFASEHVDPLELEWAVELDGHDDGDEEHLGVGHVGGVHAVGERGTSDPN